MTIVEQPRRCRNKFSRYCLGGNSTVHGGVIPLVFDWLCGMVVHATARTISRTAFLHVDCCKITPIDTPLVSRGRIDSTEGRKAFVSGELVDEDDTFLASRPAAVATLNVVDLAPGTPAAVTSTSPRRAE